MSNSRQRITACWYSAFATILLVFNNGHLTSDSVTAPITLPGNVKGVGTLDNVNVTGTFAPGFSPATVTLGSVVYSGALEVEISGT